MNQMLLVILVDVTATSNNRFVVFYFFKSFVYFLNSEHLPVQLLNPEQVLVQLCPNDTKNPMFHSRQVFFYDSFFAAICHPTKS